MSSADLDLIAEALGLLVQILDAAGNEWVNVEPPRCTIEVQLNEKPRLLIDGREYTRTFRVLVDGQLYLHEDRP